MNNKSKKITLVNTITSIILQLFTIASGFIVPKIILSTFGSETNGLISSLNQFLNFIAILEGGLNSVIMANLYKPLINNDTNKISSIIKTSRKFFAKISIILVAYSIILAITYPIIANSTFTYGFVSSLALILALKVFTQYCFSFTYQNLLRAGKYGYILNITQIIIIILDIITTLIVSNTYPDVHLLKILSAAFFLIQPIVLKKACYKLFNLKKDAKEDKKLLKERWDGLSINIASFIHHNTDIAIITIFTDLKTVSVYGVYNLVIVGLRGIIQSINNGISPSIGIIYAKEDKKLLTKRFDEYEYINFITVFYAFSLSSLLITPFVTIYTTGITDANYYQPLFGTLLLMAEFMYLIREPYVKMAYMAGKFKEQNKHAFIEAAINIVVSLLLIHPYGLIGIAIGTLAAMTYRTIFQVFLLEKDILYRPFSKSLRRFLYFCIPSIIIIAICTKYIPFGNQTVLSWLMYALIYSIIIITTYVVISLVFFKKECMGIIKYMINKSK